MNLAVIAALALWAGAWWFNVRLAARATTGLGRLLPPLLFGVTLILLWELLVRGLAVSPVLLPAPSAIAARFAGSTGILIPPSIPIII